MSKTRATPNKERMTDEETSNHIWLFISYRALYKIFTHILYRIVNHLKVKR